MGGVLTAIAEGSGMVVAKSLELNSNISDQITIHITGQNIVDNIANTAGSNVTIFPTPSTDGKITIMGLATDRINCNLRPSRKDY